MTDVTLQPPAGEREYVDFIQRQLRLLMPEDWHVGAHQRPEIPGDQNWDTVLDLVDPDGGSTRLVVQVKRSLVGRDVDKLSDRLTKAADAWGPRAVPLIASP